MATLKQINEFLDSQPIALVGVSRNSKKFGYTAFKELKEKGIKQVWIQQMADSKEALAELKDSGINFITGECILMHYKPHNIHKFHGTLKKFFGRFPK
jgi:predicted CoA-binding protein